jgi:SAM-dependent methyltransferase
LEADNLQREQEFHDDWAASIDPAQVLVEATWTAATSPERQWMLQQLGDLRGRRVLDLGCGAGEGACWFALQGAEVVASDLSPAFLDLVQRVAAHHGVTVTTVLGNAGEIELEEGSFDVVYAANVLHHVPDLRQTLDTCHKLLKPGGWLITMDPLRHNPVIEIYRGLATAVRTVDEAPLDIKVLDDFRQRFSQVRYECFWFFTLWIFLQFFLIERVHPSKERYWIKIYSEHQRLTPLYRRLARLDRWFLRRFPWFKRWCWNLAVAAQK